MINKFITKSPLKKRDKTTQISDLLKKPHKISNDKSTTNKITGQGA